MSGATAVPRLLDEWLALTARGGTLADAKAVCEAARPRVSKLRDPFLPVARGEPAARAKETVLWEDDEALVLVDAFASPPKALVVPRRELLFPVDAEPELLERLAVVSAKTSDAFWALTGSGPARIWINPPAALSVRQLHVHVMGDFAKLGPEDRADRGRAFYQRAAGELSRLLDPTQA